METQSTRRPVIFFDWDGTLADSMNVCIEELRQTLIEMKLPPRDRADLCRCNGPAFTECVNILHIPPEQAERFIELRQEIELRILPQTQKLFAGVDGMLRELAKVADLAIVSNGMPAYLEKSLRVMGLDGLFTRVQGLIRGKEKWENLGMCLREMDAPRAAMVGDMAGDILAGQRNGLPTFAACYGYGLPTDWAMAEHQAYSVAQLQEQLMAFAQGE